MPKPDESLPQSEVAKNLLALAFSAAGRMGGKAGKGKNKKRSRAHYERIGKLGAQARVANQKKKRK